jgi:hypothetical protein
MAGKLKQRAETEELTFEVFDLDLDNDDRKQLSEDPRAFFTNLLDDEGAEVNELLIGSDEKILTELGTTTPPPNPPELWHCTAPASKASKWLVIMPHLDEDA